MFVLPDGLYEWKITIAHSILAILIKNILKTFEAVILKMFETEYSASAPKLDVLKKECRRVQIELP